MPQHKTINAIEIRTESRRLFFVESTKHTLEPAPGSLLSKQAIEAYLTNPYWVVNIRAERRNDKQTFSKIEKLRTPSNVTEEKVNTYEL